MKAQVLQPERPVLRYFGGKWTLAPWLIEHFPPHRIYVEPFGGGASVLMRKPPCYSEVYNDLDGEVVNVFRVLRSRLFSRRLERALRLTPFARTEFLESYQPATDPVERARRTIVRSFMGFAGHEELCEFLTEMKGMVLLCGYRNEIYGRLGWSSIERESLADGGRARVETLWMNAAAVKAQAQQRLL